MVIKGKIAHVKAEYLSKLPCRCGCPVVEKQSKEVSRGNSHENSRQNTGKKSGRQDCLYCDRVLHFSKGRLLDPNLPIKDLAENIAFAVLLDPGL
jgi:hypothetical protein